MELELIKIVNSKDLLGKLSTLSLKDGIKVYKLTKALRTIAKELDSYEEARSKLVIKLGEPIVENGKETGACRVTKDNEEKFKDEHTKMLNTKVTLNIEPILKPEDLENFTPNEFMRIEYLIQTE